MIFTLFQYIPILEEEAKGHNTELAKKSPENDSSGNDGDELDTDGDHAIYYHLNFDFTDLYAKKHIFYSYKNDYNSFFQKINIPPPKA